MTKVMMMETFLLAASIDFENVALTTAILLIAYIIFDLVKRARS